MQLFKETASASGFCARPNAALFLQNQTEGDSEFSRWWWQCESGAECVVSNKWVDLLRISSMSPKETEIQKIFFYFILSVLMTRK